MNGKMILFCGSGGVGKTTLAASMAMSRAIQGKNVLALTIDPSRRLADAFNLKIFGNEIHRFDPQAIEESMSGVLRISMIDMHDAADRLIDRYSPSSEIAERIKANRIFRAGISTMSGIEEYISLGRVYELYQNEDFDELIIDTPPTHYALNFFKTPEQLLKILNPSNIQKIMNPLNRHKKDGTLPGSFRSPYRLGKFFRILGGDTIIRDFSEFADDLQLFFEKFRERVHHMHAVLLNPDITSIVLVSRPDYRAFSETETVFRSLQASGISVRSLIINQKTPEFCSLLDVKEFSELINKQEHFGNEPEITEYLIHEFYNHRQIIDAEKQLDAMFTKLAKNECDVMHIPRMPPDMDAVNLLSSLARILRESFNEWY